MKAIIYLRVSTQGQAEEGVSLAAQESKARAWAKLKDAEPVVFADRGISGGRADNRPGLAAALEAVGDGDALIVYSLSRLSRSTRDTLALADALAKKGADLVSLSEAIDTTSAAGKMVFRMLATLSEFERDQISDRTRFALAHKRAKGEKLGGMVPIGFRARRGKLVPYAAEQRALAIIRRARGHLNLRETCERLHSAGIEPRGLRWYENTVRVLSLKLNRSSDQLKSRGARA